jgi:hypothetical protein
LTATDSTAAAGVTYDYRLQVTDTVAGRSDITNSFVAYLYQGGAAGGTTGTIVSPIGCSFIRGL